MRNTSKYLGAPAVAVEAGCPSRFHVWQGASGRRYLFTEVEQEALAHFRDVVVLLADRSGDGALAVGRLTLLDANTDLRALLRDVVGRRRMVLVHLLARTPLARRAAIDDLSGEEWLAVAA